MKLFAADLQRYCLVKSKVAEEQAGGFHSPSNTDWEQPIFAKCTEAGVDRRK